MNVNFPSMSPHILQEINHLYDEIERLKKFNDELHENNLKLHSVITSQGKKIEVIHRLFNTYSKFVSENKRKIENIKEYVRNDNIELSKEYLSTIIQELNK